MGFKYINPGYPELFDSFGSGTLYGGSDTTRNPENGRYIRFKTAASQVNIFKILRLKHCTFGLMFTF